MQKSPFQYTTFEKTLLDQTPPLDKQIFDIDQEIKLNQTKQELWLMEQELTLHNSMNKNSVFSDAQVNARVKIAENKAMLSRAEEESRGKERQKKGQQIVQDTVRNELNKLGDLLSAKLEMLVEMGIDINDIYDFNKGVTSLPFEFSVQVPVAKSAIAQRLTLSVQAKLDVAERKNNIEIQTSERGSMPHSPRVIKPKQPYGLRPISESTVRAPTGRNWNQYRRSVHDYGTESRNHTIDAPRYEEDLPPVKHLNRSYNDMGTVPLSREQGYRQSFEPPAQAPYVASRNTRRVLAKTQGAHYTDDVNYGPGELQDLIQTPKKHVSLEQT